MAVNSESTTLVNRAADPRATGLTAAAGTRATGPTAATGLTAATGTRATGLTTGPTVPGTRDAAVTRSPSEE